MTPRDTDSISTTGAPESRQNWPALAIMVALIVMSLIDRLMLALLVKPLKADLLLSDVQLGLLFGTAFAVFYGLMGLPLARIADRFHRVRLVTIAVILWSICTILSGFATAFWELLLLRAGLAVGEAALFPTVHSLIYDMFDVRRRPLAASIATAAAPLGGALAFVAGGGLLDIITVWVADGGGFGFRPWQLVFFAVGIPSLALGFLFGGVVREPERVGRVGGPAQSNAFEALRGQRLMFVWLLLAGGVCQVIPYAYQAWAPTLLTDKYALSMSTAGFWLGVTGASGAILGTFVVPLVVMRYYDRGAVSALTSIPMMVVLAGAVIFGFAPLHADIAFVLISYFFGSFAMLGANATIFVSMQRLAPDNLRATMVAGTLLVSSSLGLGLGPIGVAFLATAISNPPRFDIALAVTAILAGMTALAFFGLARRCIGEQPTVARAA